MTGTRLQAEDLLPRLAINISEAHSPATLDTIDARNATGVIRIARVCNEVVNAGRIDPVFAVVLELSEKTPQINRGHVAYLVVRLAPETVARAVIVVVAQVRRIRTDKSTPVGQREDTRRWFNIIDPASVVVVTSAEEQTEF